MRGCYLSVSAGDSEWKVERLWKPRGCFDRWNVECKSAIVNLKTMNECVYVKGTMSCNAREEVGHLDLLEAGASCEEAGEAGSTEGLANRQFLTILDEARETLSCE